MAKDWLSDKPFAHRGLHGSITGHVENSLSAFLAASQKGHGFELDILLSQDDKAMVYHDLTLTRLTGMLGKIQDFTADQLSKIPLGSTKDTILTLKKILQKVNTAHPILIEIKGDQGRPEAIAQAVYQDIKDYEGPVAIMSFTPEIVRWFQQKAPQIHRGLVATPIKSANAEDQMPVDYYNLADQKRRIDYLLVDFIAYDIGALPNEVTEYCRHQKIPVLTWTVRSEDQQHSARHYADNIIYEIRDR